MTHATCKDCPDRRNGCHSQCDKYKQFKAERNAELEKIKKSRGKYNDMSGYQWQKYKRLTK